MSGLQTVRANAVVDNLSLVNSKSVVVVGLHARSLSNNARNILDSSTHIAQNVVMVVVFANLVAGLAAI